MLYYIFLSLNLLSIILFSFYILSTGFFPKHKGLSDARVTSITKKEYRFPVNLLQSFKRSWKSISDQRLNAIC